MVYHDRFLGFQWNGLSSSINTQHQVQLVAIGIIIISSTNCQTFELELYYTSIDSTGDFEDEP